ncbi:hypothetical protein CK203_080249 [Vitis vinifera]|uniref:Uncharacterized protein n=1 Tax=Vitis vinifera TaxID=29760 RepID=A0A438ENZ1_VITVI|nr:hypothetical protein CK203_080249 [Vitis vinifera]
MSLKLLINKKDDKVVFAEVKNDFMDFLFNHFLTLPIGTIEVDVLEEKVVSIGLEEALHLLHCALHSEEALTNVFL